MINLIFRSKFESQLTSFITFLGLNLFFAWIMFGIVNSSHDRRDQIEIIGNQILILLMILLVRFWMAQMKEGKEKRCRLYALLPVSPMQTRIAYWCLAALYTCISTMVFVLVLYYVNRVPFRELPGYAVFYLMHAGVILALASIASNNSIRLIPAEVRQRTILYFFLAAMLTFLVLLSAGLVIGGYIFIVEGGVVDWFLLTVILGIACIALVIFDIHLYQKCESYLG